MTDWTPSQIAELLNHLAPLWLQGLNLNGANPSGADLRKVDLSEIS